MSENFLYSEAITTADADGTITDSYTNMVSAEDLNNIALDIGHPDFSHFSDEGTYAVDELNEITKSLVTEGILYVGNRCSLSYDANNSRIVVKSGVGVFKNGAKVRVKDTDTLAIDYIPGGKNYIYFLNDTSSNRILLCNSLVKPTETVGDFISLGTAEADSAGNIVTKNIRTLSCGRYANMDGYNIIYIYDATGDNALRFPESPAEPYKVSVSFATGGFNFVAMHVGKVYHAIKFDSQSNEIETTLKALSDTTITSFAQWCYLKFVKNGNKVEITAWGTGTSRTAELTLYFF